MADLNESATTSPRALSVGRPENFYPSPYFDVARTYMPDTVKATFDWCSYYYLTNPIVHGVVTKLAAYAITDLIYKDDPQALVYKNLFEGPLNLRTVCVEHNLDRSCFGNGFLTVAFPIIKKLTCTSCKEEVPASKADYKWRGSQFVMKCKKCDATGVAKVRDETQALANKIRLVRWNPKNITIKRNEITGECRYFYAMPQYMRNDLKMNNRRTIEQTPQPFLEALTSNKLIELDANMLFHSRRPSISRDPVDNGWGTPLLMPVLKDLFLLQVMKKAQEAVLMEHTLPFRSVFPQVSADGNNIYANVNLKDWQKGVRTEIQQWKKDPNYIAVLPVPIGQETMGGNGKGLMLSQDMRFYGDQIISGLGAPVGFFYGEAQFSGANINLRAMENEFIPNRQDLEHLVEFIIQQISRGMGWEPTVIKFKPFKMADDLPRAGMAMQLVQQGMLSRQTFLASLDYDYAHEDTQIGKEAEDLGRRAKKQAEANAAAQAITMEAQMKAQIAAQQMAASTAPPSAEPSGGTEPPDPAQQAADGPPGVDQGQLTAATMQGPGVDIHGQAQTMAAQLGQLSEIARYGAMIRLRKESPEVYMLAKQILSSKGQPGGPEGLTATTLPEQRPPRAGAGRSMV